MLSPYFFIIMCNYRDENMCNITHSVCPWVYWCDKVNIWKELSKKPSKCKVVNETSLPDGYYKVEFERKGYLYINVDRQIVKIKNVFDYTPNMVKLYQDKNEWKIRKE